MKTFLSTLVLLASISSFAGTLVNKQTGESLEFKLSEQKAEAVLIITSRSTDLNSKEIKLQKVQMKKSDINLTAGIDYASDDIYHLDYYWRGEEVGGYLVSTLLPIFNLPMLLSMTYDFVALPFKAPVKIAQNISLKKDLKMFLKAVNSEEQISVSNKRFKRIEALLK